jgi:hypothetical protein
MTESMADRIEQAVRARFAGCDLSHPLTRALFELCLARAWRRAGLPSDPAADRR